MLSSTVSEFSNMSEQERRQIRMYGVTVAGMREAVEQSINIWPGHGNAAFMAVSIMSDVQEMMAHMSADDWITKEDARQALNRAKWILSNYVLKSEQTT